MAILGTIGGGGRGVRDGNRRTSPESALLDLIGGMANEQYYGLKSFRRINLSFQAGLP